MTKYKSCDKAYDKDHILMSFFLSLSKNMKLFRPVCRGSGGGGGGGGDGGGAFAPLQNHILFRSDKDW